MLDILANSQLTRLRQRQQPESGIKGHGHGHRHHTKNTDTNVAQNIKFTVNRRQEMTWPETEKTRMPEKQYKKIFTATKHLKNALIRYSTVPNVLSHAETQDEVLPN